MAHAGAAVSGGGRLGVPGAGRARGWWGGRVMVTGAALALAAFWVWMGLAKAAHLAGPVLGWGKPAATWADQFHPALLWGAVVIQLVIGLALALGREAMGLMLAIGFLLIATLLLWWYPVAPGQACGCGGDMARKIGLGAVDPMGRNAVLAGVHLVVLALVAPAGRREQRSEALG